MTDPQVMAERAAAAHLLAAAPRRKAYALCCTVCGGDFRSALPYARYCSERCRAQHRLARKRQARAAALSH